MDIARLLKQRMARRLVIAGLSLVAALALARGASAQEGTDTGVTDDEVNAVASELYCPICENVPLDVCPTQACADWRAEIRGLMEEGRSEAEIRDYFVERYGLRVLGEPPRKGFTALVWILPGVGLAIGAGMLGRSLMNMRRAPAMPQAAQPTPEPEDEDAAYVARLEQELKDFTL